MNQIPIQIAAGDYTLDFEPWSGWVRDVRHCGVLVLAAAYATPRYQNWETPHARVEFKGVVPIEGGWRGTWTAVYDNYRIDGRFDLGFEGLTYDIRGQAISDFKSRRCGLCVLHPARQAGCDVAVFDAKGQQSKHRLPRSIDPESPFTDIARMSVADGDTSVDFQFFGEVFEIEDQRNYSDYSFKTYCRPQRWPQPFEIRQGDVIQHSVIMRCQPVKPIGISKHSQSMPMVGLAAESNPLPWQIHRVEALNLDFLLGGAEWPAGLTSKAPKLDFEMKGEAHAYAASHGLYIDLARSLPKDKHVHGVAFTTNSQVHTTDSRTIMENVAGVAEQVRSAKSALHQEHVVVGPAQFSGAPDNRLRQDFGAAWLLSSLIQWSLAGPDAILPLKTHGKQNALFDEIDEPNLLHRVLGWVPRHGTPIFAVQGLPEGLVGMAFGGPDRMTLANTNPYPAAVVPPIGYKVLDRIGHDEIVGPFIMPAYSCVLLQI